MLFISLSKTPEPLKSMCSLYLHLYPIRLEPHSLFKARTKPEEVWDKQLGGEGVRETFYQKVVVTLWISRLTISIHADLCEY